MKKTSQKETILVVDDIEDNVNLIGGLLEEEGFNVIRTTDGAEALDIIARNKIDLVLADIVMQDIDGRKICKTIKANPRTRHIPVILLSANRTNVTDIAQGLEMGADEFIPKPVDRQELLARVPSMARIKSVCDELELKKIQLEKANMLLQELPSILVKG